MRRALAVAMRAPSLSAQLRPVASGPLAAAWVAPRAPALEAAAGGCRGAPPRGGLFRAVSTRRGDGAVDAHRHSIRSAAALRVQPRWIGRRALSSASSDAAGPDARGSAPAPALLAALGADPTPGPAANAPLRAVFFGNPQECLPVLSALLGAPDRVSLAAVVCSVGKPRGRGRKEAPPLPVEALAREAGIEVLRTSDAGRDLELAERLRALAPDLFVTAAFGGYLSKRLRAIPRCGTLNVHPSALPRLRGAAPVQRAIEAGADELAVSVLYSVRAMDAGPVLAQAAWTVGDEQAYEVDEGASGGGKRREGRDAASRAPGRAGADAELRSGGPAGAAAPGQPRGGPASALARPAWAWGVGDRAWELCGAAGGGAVVAASNVVGGDENADANAPSSPGRPGPDGAAPAPKRARAEGDGEGAERAGGGARAPTHSPPALSAPLAAPWTSLTSSQTIERLFFLGAAALLSRLDDVAAGTAFSRARAQDEALATHAARLRGEEGRLDPASMTAEEASRHVRAFAGWPGSVLEVALSGGKREKRERWKVLSAEVARRGAAGAGDRAVVPSADASRLLMPCRSGALAIRDFVVAGKKPTNATEYLRGLRGRSIRWLRLEEEGGGGHGEKPTEGADK